MRWALVENGVVSLITNQDDKPTIDGLWVECGDAGPGWIYQDGNFSQPQASNPTEWLIDIGPFFDRFGAAKMGILMSSNATVKAILSDLQVRKWIDLKRADVADGLDSLIALSTPPVENSNPERVAPQGADGQGVCTPVKYQIDVLFNIRGVLEQRTYCRKKACDVGRLCALATAGGAVCILLTLVP